MTEKNTDSSSSNKEPFKFRPWNASPKLYIGNLGEKADKYEIEKTFQKFGPVKNVWVAKAQPGFAFIEFEDPSITERVSNEIYGVSSDSRGVSASSKARQSQSLKNPLAIKVPTEDRPGDWLCPSQTCTNVNFSWREYCNKCETRNPAVKETKEERRRRIYGNNNDYFRAVTSYANRGQRSRGRGSKESTDRQGYHGHSNNGRENHRNNGRENHRDNGRENHRDNGRENHRYNGRENHRGNLRECERWYYMGRTDELRQRQRRLVDEQDRLSEDSYSDKDSYYALSSPEYKGGNWEHAQEHLDYADEDYYLSFEREHAKPSEHEKE